MRRHVRHALIGIAGALLFMLLWLVAADYMRL